jgi:deoxycytidylate deaminase
VSYTLALIGILSESLGGRGRIMARDRRWINLARKIAEQNNFPKYKMACVVVRGGRVLAIGINRITPGILKHPAYCNKAMHAELDAILQINRAALHNSTVYVAGVSKGKNLIKSKPCPSCQQMLREFGIHSVVWHTPEDELIRERVV